MRALEQLYQALGRQRLFRGVSLEAIEHFLYRIEEQCFEAGEVIFCRDQNNHTLYLLVEGEVSVHLDKADSDPLQYLHEGDCFGEMSLVDAGKTSAFVIARSPCRCLLLDEATLWGMVNHSHGVARNLLLIVVSRLRSDNDALITSNEKLEQWESLALTDVLTGFYNRRWLNTSLPALIKRHQMASHPLSLILLDVDNFKRFNDQWGHLGGDQALRSLSMSLRHHLRPSDIVTRYGGEEFVIVLPDTSLDQAKGIAERLCNMLAITPCGFYEQDELPPITVSMGVSIVRENEDSESLLKRVDQGLYQAKHLGRNRVVVI